MFMEISLVSYLTWAGTNMEKPACCISIVLTEIPGMVIVWAKNMVLGHLLHVISYWHLVIGYERFNAVRYVWRFGAALLQLGYF